MTTTIDEISAGIYRISTWVEQIAPPAGFTFNQFLIDADEPLLFHTGPRHLFPAVSEAVAKVVPLDYKGALSYWYVGPNQASPSTSRSLRCTSRSDP